MNENEYMNGDHTPTHMRARTTVLDIRLNKTTIQIQQIFCFESINTRIINAQKFQTPETLLILSFG